MERTEHTKLPFIDYQRHFNGDYTESSGISVSGETDNTISMGVSARDRLRYIAQQHDGFDAEEEFTPFLPRIETKPAAEKDPKMKCDYRVSLLSKLQQNLPELAVPKTVGKYRHRVKVVPIVSLPAPSSPQPAMHPSVAHVVLREQYFRERNQPSPDFKETELARIFDRYPISRFLSSRDGRRSRSNIIHRSPTRSTGFCGKKSLPSIKDLGHIKAWQNVPQESAKLTWVQRLGTWVQSDPQNQPLQYLKLNSEAKLTVKALPFCSHHHDFYHKNLHWDLREHVPYICPRFSDHHYQKHHHGRKLPPKKSKIDPSKRKILTVPRDPFTSKEQRTIKRPWLKPPTQTKETPEPKIHLVLPSEKDDNPYHWMVDNATMTDDSLSDVYSLPANNAAHSISPVPSDVTTRNLVQIKKKRVEMVDQACDVMILSSIVSSPTPSLYTEDNDVTDSMFGDAPTPKDVKEEINNTISGAKNNVAMVTPDEYKLPSEVPQLSKDQDEDLNDSAVDMGSGESDLPDENLEASVPSEEDDFSEEPLDDEDLSEKETQQVDENDDDGIISNLAGNTVDSYVANVASESDGSTRNSSSRTPSPVMQIKAKPPKKSPIIRRRALPPLPPPPTFIDSGTSTCHSDDEKSDVTVTSAMSSQSKQPIVVPLPKFLEHPGSSRSTRSSRSRISIHTPSTTASKKSAKRRGKVIRDMALADEMRRMKEAEERRRKAHEKFQKMKEARLIPTPATPFSEVQASEEGGFDSQGDGFLDKYCIVNPSKVDYYRRIFDSIDDDGDGHLDSREMMEAVLKILPNEGLTESDLHYIYRLLELADYDMYAGRSDFRLFAIVVSLAQRVASLDDFMRGIIDRFDFQSVDMKLWRARQLFKRLVDNQERETMSQESLCLELKACGIPPKQELLVRKSLKHLKQLDVMDFLTYLPLFAMVHSNVIKNPLREECTA
ncbi:uncharacterized protein LOC143448732 isoform X3 [Clavelina lepadiformis]|uniref:uncharacterized protein LOC143448732 isoform X3 n=1 Tax=Clavelina lepadiformis TaxID=159417 RepID=UPI00404168B0